MIGQSISHYKITSKIGEGGMGEVYRAIDTKLNREVALKVLPESFAHDPERMGRFQREAQVLASLNHPNIAAIYGLEEGLSPEARGLHKESPTSDLVSTTSIPESHASRQTCLVMELVEGEDLSKRIAQGLIPLEEALPIALKLAEALENAHEKGIIHRDLKPANIKLSSDGKVKILDFGLAKALEGGDQPQSADLANSPTLTMQATQAGFILGTAGYMSPEQASGQAADRRSDIWSFGVVLFEMLTGRTLFAGETLSHTLARVLERNPDWSELPENTATPIRRLIERCLRRNVKQRLQSIGDARIEIQDYLSNPEQFEGISQVSETQRRRPVVPWAVAAVMALVAGLSVLPGLLETPEKPDTLRFTLGSSEEMTLSPGSTPVLSPRGRKLVMHGTADDGRSQLWVRDLNNFDLRVIPGTEDASFPFWSPDGEFLGFFSDGTLKRISTSAGGTPLTLADAPNPGGGTWNEEGHIIFSPGVPGTAPVSFGPLFRVPASGGPTTAASELDPSLSENGHELPFFFPDGHHFGYQAYGEEGAYLKVGTIGTTESRRILDVASNVAYSEPGYLLYTSQSSLFAHPFNLESLETKGNPMPIVESIGKFIFYSEFSVSSNGFLAYRTGSPDKELVWRNRQGAFLDSVGDPGDYRQLALSPDGKRVALSLEDDIWIYELKNGVFSKFTLAEEMDGDPIWSADSKALLYSSRQDGPSQPYLRPLASREPRLLAQFGEERYSEAWSPDGTQVLLIGGGGLLVSALDLTQEEPDPVLLLESTIATDGYEFSPDGRWVAYNSEESGRWEVYVASYPDFNNKRQLSTSSGCQPMWRSDGKELFYLELTGRLMSVELTLGNGVEANAPKALFHTNIPIDPILNRYAVNKDGDRFLMLEQNISDKVNLVVNWTSELEN